MADAVAAIHASGFASIGHMACTIWETAWYLRSMEDLMADMMDDDPKAEWLLDQITIRSCQRAAAFARSGADILALGDDIGMQHSIMMSLPFYRTWLKPRLAQVIRAARSIKPDMLVMYHSCGYIEPFIPDLIEAGVDILDPVQPECMDFKRLHDLYGAQLSFHGTIGTQTTMPFGTPDDVRRAVFRNLDIAGPKGGLMCAPTHLLEPEVPWANIMAYVDACRDYMR
jgi:uroporphyrinogen decarboxylase